MNGRSTAHRPRRRAWTSLSPAAELVIVLPLVAVLHWAGAGGRAPAAVVVGAQLLPVLLQRRDLQLWLGGGDPAGRLWLRAVLLLGVGTPSSLYVLGWGPILVVAQAVVALTLLRIAGARAWAPAVGGSLLGVGVGQAGTALGWFPTYLTPVQAQLSGLAGAVLVVILLRRFGLQMTELERSERALDRSGQRFRALVQHSSDLTMVWDVDGVIRFASPAAEAMLGTPPRDLVGGLLIDVILPEERHRARRLGEELITLPDVIVRTEMRFVHRDGAVRWHEVTVRNMLDNPAVRGLVSNHRDVTEQRLAQEKLTYEATHDMLTGLHNRASFMLQLHAALARAAHAQDRLAVLFLDLNGFKAINDSLGHEAGDVVLMSVAAVLRHQVLGSDLLGRLGGDEFAVVLPQIGTAENAGKVATRILDALAEPIPFHGHSLVVAGSIGVAVAGGDGEPVEPQEVLRRADLAMYRAKRSRSSRWEGYHAGLEPASLISAEEIRDAVEGGQLFLLYQPLVSLSTGVVEGLEALVRWRHPVRGVVPPSELVPAAQEHGLIGLLGEWVLREACRQLAAWRRDVPVAADLRLGVNVAADQLDDPRTVALVESVLDGCDLPAGRLVVEVTESALVDSPQARDTLEALHDRGVQIAIDDFGTGYSSLQYLTRLPVDVLKLDRAFVTELDGTAHSGAIAEAVLRLSETLDLHTTAEGVETPEQAGELAALGYLTAQGFLFAAPLAPDAVEELLARGPFTIPTIPTATPVPSRAGS